MANLPRALVTRIERSRTWRPHLNRWMTVAILALAIAVPLLVRSNYFISVANTVATYVVLGLGLNIVIGFARSAGPGLRGVLRGGRLYRGISDHPAGLEPVAIAAAVGGGGRTIWGGARSANTAPAWRLPGHLVGWAACGGLLSEPSR